MRTFHPSTDYRGARGSNAGDQFHEFWALEQILELLRPGTALRAVSVEGVASETPRANGEEPMWDGVDCALYFGEPSLEHADAVEFIQLKYSAANPEKVWTVARLKASTAKKVNNSVIRRMAEVFKSAKARMKPGAQLKIRLVSNQGLSDELKQILSARWTGKLSASGLAKQLVANLEILRKAAGLSQGVLAAFIECLDFDQTGQGSRFATKARVFDIVANALGNDVSSEVRDLQNNVRNLMLPERAGEFTTEKDLLLWFGLSGREGLFPSRPDISLPTNRIPRAAARDAVKLLQRGERLLLVHGGGGCGKTTLMHEIADRLPEGSVAILFDCFGGGRYFYSDDKRHLSQNAFLQITNDVALALKLPLFIPRNLQHPASIQSFLAKVRIAGDALQQNSPGALLVINIDAADNAVTVAANAQPAERPFVFDIGEANLADLPTNVRFVISARTARKDSLRLPAGTKEVICPPFSRDETQRHLISAFQEVSDALVEQFHMLSNQNPRVQAYALVAAAGDSGRAVEVLLPGGKVLADVLEATFDAALKRLGQRGLFDKFVSVLAHLPAPAAISAIAGVTGAPEPVIRDLVLDLALAPGLRLQEEAVTIADEDFDWFIKDRAAPDRENVLGEIASYFAANYVGDAYSSSHLADSLIAAGRAQEILQAIERDPDAAAIRDPILRRQVQVRRLKLALAACRHAGSKIDVLKTVLISAEAERDDSTLSGVLTRELDLSVEFAGPSLRRTILLDPDRVEEHGSFLVQDAVRAIRAGDRVTAREQMHFYSAWLRRRHRVPDEQREEWTIADRDVAARVETILELDSAAAALMDILSWRPRDLALRVADILVPHLIASGKVDRLHTLLHETALPRPWDLLVRVPLAMAGEPVEADAIGRSLKRIHTRLIPDMLGSHAPEENWSSKLLDTFITACELGYLLGVDEVIVASAIDRILDVLHGKQSRQLYKSEFHRLDGLLRCWLLKAALSGNTSARGQDFIAHVRSLDPPSKAPDQTHGKRRERHQQEEQERRDRKIQALFPVYAARIDILASAARHEPITGKQLEAVGAIASHAYDFDFDYNSVFLRQMASRSVSRLLIVPSISAKKLIARASALVQGPFIESVVPRELFLWETLRLRTAAAGRVVELAAKAATSIKTQRAAASEKVDALIQLSRLILPVSRDDAQIFFNDAVAIAKEIDEEAIDQIDFLSAAGGCADISRRGERQRIAQDVFAFVSESSDRLSARGFPWQTAVAALTYLDGPMALAAICRWADDGTIGLEKTLNAFLRTALDRNIIDAEVAQSLILLLTRVDEHDDDDDDKNEIHKELVSRAIISASNGKARLEELSKDVLLLNPQHARHELGAAITGKEPADKAPDGPWLMRLKQTLAFLKTEAVAAKPEAESSFPAPVIFPVENEEPVTTFELDLHDGKFVTSAAIAEMLQQAAGRGAYHVKRDMLRKMREASSQPRDRAAFLTALMDLPVDAVWLGDSIEILSETIKLWRGTPSVGRWCKDTLPRAIVAQFNRVARWLKGGDSALPKLLELAELTGDDQFKVLVEGVSCSGDDLGSRTLFGIAEIMAHCLTPTEAGAILDWYAQRVRMRLPADGPPAILLHEVPTSMPEAVGRFLFALMSDIDTRIRWKAAHALRRMARLQCSEVVKAAVDQLARTQEAAFRDPAAPFYFLAARLWLLIATYRISAETPQALAGVKDMLLHVAAATELPHVAIREYAKRTLTELSAANSFLLTPEEQARLAAVNTPAKGTVANDARHPSFDFQDSKESRFKFNVLSTLRYWYNDILRIFPTVTKDEVLELAEHWIIEKWGADAEANYKKFRNSRYDERHFGLYSNDRGSLPILERYGTHLEWNAMHCVIGELLLRQPISDETDYGSFEYWLNKSLPSEPPQWLSDLRGPTPLERRFWVQDPRTDNGWVRSVRQEEFRYELSGEPPHPEWIVVAGKHTSNFPRRQADVGIKTALVSPGTAAALVRALQTATDPHDFCIPDEDDSLQFEEPPYQLQGWLASSNGEERFDGGDPLRYEVGIVCKMPGQEITEALGLVAQSGMHRMWVCRHSKAPAFVYEAWCNEPAPEEYPPRRIRCEGWRLWANPDVLNSFLLEKKMHLICKVQIDRRLQSEYSRSYESDAKKSKVHKIFLLKGGGSLEDARGRLGTWQGASKRTRTRSRRGHARPLDGASHRGTDSRSRGRK